MESERLVPVKPEILIGPGQHNHDPRTQRTYTEELRREPITDKCVTLTNKTWHMLLYMNLLKGSRSLNGIKIIS